MNSAVSHVFKTISEGLLYGFTFALGWVFALLLVGVAVA